MRTALILLRLGALGLVLEAGLVFEMTRQDGPLMWIRSLILFGFPVLCGLSMLGVRPAHLEKGWRTLMYITHGAALLSVLWIVLWCFVWLSILSGMDNYEMTIKHTAYLHLFGVSFTMGGYATAWMTPRLGERSARFLMTVGWAASYVAWFNMYLLKENWFWAPAIGGLMVVLGAFLIERQLKRVVEAPPQLS